MNRREFLKASAWTAGLSAFAPGCASRPAETGFGGRGAPMQGFRCGPIDTVRVAFAGVGGRGTSAMYRIAQIPGCRVVAICDLRQSRMDVCNGWLAKNGFAKAREYVGPEAYKAMCDSPDVDVVYVAGSWQMHEMVGIYAVKAGKHTFVEVPAAMTLDGCWEFVEAAEKSKVHCMQLENCCYGEEELLALNLVRKGILGDPVYADCAYIHDLRYMSYSELEGEPGDHKRGYWQMWRLMWNAAHKGNQYPTHGLGPVCQYMNINRGDRMTELVSLETDPMQNEAYAKAMFPADDWRAKLKVEMGDMNMTTVRTAKGRLIHIKHDVTTPGPYGRINRIVCTRGLMQGASSMDREDAAFPYRVGWSDKIGEHVGYFSAEKAEEVRRKFRHPYFAAASDIAKKIGGHGGMDFMMDLRWVYCLRNGLPMDMDVYDLASWCSICELSERAVRERRMIEVPDFTRGGWRTAEPLGIVTVDMSRFGFDKDKLRGGTSQMNV